MTFKELVEHKKALFPEYARIFGVVPSELRFSCTDEQYVQGLKEAIRTGKPLEELLPMEQTPDDPNLWT